VGRQGSETQTGGREATTGVIPGRFALSVGKPDTEPPPGWRWTALSEVARMESGHTPSRRVPEYWDGDVPWIGIRDATEHHGRTLGRTNQTVSQAGIDNSSARVLPAGTVCLSRTASVGYVVVMGRPMATSQDFVNWVCSDAIDNCFLKYVLVSEHDSMLRFASGTTHQTIYYPEAKAFHVCLPPLPEQRAIANILGALDDKIELNRRMNETLETMARAIFKSWFVDFDPVRAKAEGRQPIGMDAETAALFPDSFQDSSLGKIPKGWRVSQIGDVVGAVGGSTPRTEEPKFWEGEINFCTPKDMASLQSPVLLDTERRITQAGLEQISSGLLPRGTVILSSRAPIGYLAIAEIPVAVNQGIVAMICDRELPNLYVLNWTKENLDTIIANANGTTFLEISKKNFRPISVLVPPASIRDCFMQIAMPLHRKIVGNLAQSKTLASVRDKLLPRLVSGEIRINGPEQRLGVQS